MLLEKSALLKWFYHFWGKKLSFWRPACSVLIVVPLLCVLLSLWALPGLFSYLFLERKVLGNCIDS